MAFELPNFVVNLPAAADLSANQYQFVKINSSGQAALAASAGEAVIGVLQNKPTSGQVAQIMVQGITKVLCGGTVTAGDLVASDASGKAKTAVKATVDSTVSSATDAVVGSAVVGRCITTAANNQIATLLLQAMGAVATTAA